MTKNNSNSLAIIERSGTEVALPVDLVQDARRFAENARSRGTQVFYGKLWRYFCDWCREGGMDPLSPDGVPTNITTMHYLIKPNSTLTYLYAFIYKKKLTSKLMMNCD